MAMLLRECKALAEKSAGQTISDAVITVPPYFNQAERRAVADAADIAGLTLLQVCYLPASRAKWIYPLFFSS